MLAKVVDRNPLYCMKNFCYRVKFAITKQTVIQIKESLFLLHANIKLHVVS